MKEYIIGKNEEGKRLDKFLKTVLSKAPDSFVYKMLRKKNIKLNDKKAEGNEKLSLNDSVKIYLSDETFELMHGVDKATSDNEYSNAYKALKGIKVEYEDEDIIIFYKPSGILSQKAKPEDLSLNEYLIGYLLESSKITDTELNTFKPSVCNRLDRNTDGLVICSKSLKGSRYAAQIIKNRFVRKYYYALVKGVIKDGASIEGYLKKDASINKVSIFKEKPKNGEYDYIHTIYKPLKNTKDLTLLEIELITGKPHQIRAHMASIGHPLLGDVKYGDREFNKLYGANMQFLTAARLEFPKNNEIESLNNLIVKVNKEAIKKYEHLEKQRS